MERVLHTNKENDILMKKMGKGYEKKETFAKEYTQ